MLDHETTVPAGHGVASPPDVVLFVRPAYAGKRHDDETAFSWSYKEFAEWSTHSLVNHVGEMIAPMGEGKYITGIRQKGDEQYTQRFMVVNPHADERFPQLVKNHLHGVLNHWKA